MASIVARSYEARAGRRLTRVRSVGTSAGGFVVVMVSIVMVSILYWYKLMYATVQYDMARADGKARASTGVEGWRAGCRVQTSRAGARPRSALQRRRPVRSAGVVVVIASPDAGRRVTVVVVSDAFRPSR